MMLYLTGEQNQGVFDFLQDETDIMIKKVTGEISLFKFFINDMRNLSLFRFVAVDMKCLRDTTDELLQAVSAFQSMYSSRIIFYSGGFNNTGDTVERLRQAGVLNIVAGVTMEDIKKEIRLCVSEHGMSYAKPVTNEPVRDEILPPDNKPVLKKTYLFKDKNTEIAVAGIMPRTGTTTTAIQLAYYLSSLGAKVTYVEANSTNALFEILKKTTNKDVTFSSMGTDDNADYDFIIYDVGVLNEHNAVGFCDGCIGVRILCGCSKPYELPALLKCRMFDKTLKYNLLLSFTPPASQDALRAGYQTEYRKVLFPYYAPSGEE